MILAKRALSIIALTVSAVLIPGAALTSANSIPSGNDPPAIRKGQSIPAPILEKRASKQETNALSDLLFQDFESGAVNWVTTGSWQIGAPVSGPAGGFSSPNAAATSLSGNYPDNANDVLLSPSISIPTQGNVVVSFDEWFQLESCCDAGFVEASQDGGATWTALGTPRTGSSGWRNLSLSYTATAAPLQLRFRLTSDGSVTYSGWYIDNVRIALNTPDPIEVSLKTLNAKISLLSILPWE